MRKKKSADSADVTDSARRNRDDFMRIRLSAAGIARARGVDVVARELARPEDVYDGPRGEPRVRVAGGGTGADSRGYEFEFVPDEVQDVTRAEWAAIFEPLTDAQGQPLFEVVEKSAAADADSADSTEVHKEEER